jgi:hypothetical protein
MRRTRIYTIGLLLLFSAVLLNTVQAALVKRASDHCNTAGFSGKFVVLTAEVVKWTARSVEIEPHVVLL